jgi:hypothetical protein
MPAVVEELFQGRTEVVSSKPSAEIPYIVRQAVDEDAVKSAALTATPTLYAGMPRKSVEISERINADSWKVVVRYEAQEVEQQQEEPEPVFSFDTGGGTQHITQSLQTVSKHGPAATDKLGGAIGFDGENVEGVDVTVPVYNFSETHYLPASAVTSGYRVGIFRATGTVNSGGFRGFSAGEVLFLGASGSRRGTGRDDDWEITYKFAAQPNRSNIRVGDISGISKKGWEYLWVQYAADVDNETKQVIKKPVAVYIEKVYPSGSFGALGIGG